jgi:hypothetical protein
MNGLMSFLDNMCFLGETTRSALLSCASTLVVLGLSGLLLTGCDSTAELTAADQDGRAVAAEQSSALMQAAEAAALSDEQAAQVRRIVAATVERRRDPGALWDATAQVNEVLSPDQRSALIEAVRRAWAERRDRMQAERSGSRARRSRGAQLRRLLRGLDLTDAQKEELAALRKAFREDLRALRPTRGERPDDETREAMRARARAFREAVQAVLTDEQRAQLQARRAQQQERRAQRMARRAEGFAAMVEALDLTDAQKAALVERRAERRRARRARAARRHRTADRTPLLTEPQREVLQLHRILRAEVRRRIRSAARNE